MDKLILKKIAKEWAKGILIATDGTAFEGDLLTQEEQNYILEEVNKIADRIWNDYPSPDLNVIIKKYYEVE